MVNKTVISSETNTCSQVNVSEETATLIINDLGQILFVQSVTPAIGELSWGLPTGRIIQGETPAEAAVRGLFEGTGFVVVSNHLLPLGFINLKNETLSSQIHMFLHKTSKPRRTAAFRTNDAVVANVTNWIHKVRVIEAIKTNEITDSVTVATFEKARLLGII